MEINGNSGAATYATKQALAMPNILLDLVRESIGNDQRTRAVKDPIFQIVDVSALTGKGKIIDRVV